MRIGGYIYPRHNGCGDCGYGCCCKCRRRDKNCRFCNYKGGYNFRRCKEIDYPHKYACFTCRKVWKNDLHIYSHDNINKTIDYVNMTSIKCSICKNEGVHVYRSFRAPKRKDKKQWQLLEKLMMSKELDDSPPGSLGKYWIKNGGFGCTQHMDDRYRIAMQIPYKLNEYDDWVEHMKNTQFNSVN